MSELTFSVFQPRDGAVLDLKSLQVLAKTPHHMLCALLAAQVPGASGLVLEGLELVGTPSPQGPPGAVRPDAETNHATITPGRAIVQGQDGQVHLVQVKRAVQVPWPDSNGPRVRGALVLHAEGLAAGTEEGVQVARDTLTIRIGFVKPAMADQPHLLQLASAVGNHQDWATDLCRLLQPEHPVVQALLKRFEALQDEVWNAEAEGSVWDRQILGRSWVRYQTVGASALQAARTLMASQAMTTPERVRMLCTLRHQLERSVERVATSLLQIVGPPEGAGPYEAVVVKR